MSSNDEEKHSFQTSISFQFNCIQMNVGSFLSEVRCASYCNQTNRLASSEIKLTPDNGFVTIILHKIASADY